MSKEDMNHQVLFTDYPDIVNVEQLSAMLGISTKTAYKLLKEEKIKSIHIEGTYRIAKVHVLNIWNYPNNPFLLGLVRL